MIKGIIIGLLVSAFLLVGIFYTALAFIAKYQE